MPSPDPRPESRPPRVDSHHLLRRRYVVRFTTTQRGPIHTGAGYDTWLQAARAAQAMRDRGDADLAWAADALGAS